MSEYIVQQGDCTSSLAGKSGLFWETIWNHPQNAELKSKRKDPNILVPGDKIFIPEKELKQVDCASDQKHRFKRKGVPVILRLRLMHKPDSPQQKQQARRPPSYPPPKDGTEQLPQEQSDPTQEEPWTNVRYVTEIDGNLTEGRTGNEGIIEVIIPPAAQSGRLMIEPGTPHESVIPLQLGHLNPTSMVSGVKQRLSNLGISCGDFSEEETEAFAAAVRIFQAQNGLEETGEMNDQTRQKLQEIHGD